MTIDKQALRQIAESVDREEWDVLDNGDADYQVIVSGSLERGATYRSYQPVTNEISNKKIAAFIAAFNPKVALALLDENLQLQREKDAIEAVALALRDDMRQAREQLEAAEKRIADGSKRIAELESNEVREVGNKFLVVRHPGKTPAIKHCTGDLEDFLRKLIEQDPLVTIDIITHRYYGVGGQWVQDAGEYLQMMQGAGIGVKQQEDSVDSDVGRNQPGMVVAVHIGAGDFVKFKGQVFEVEETDFDDHDVTLWFVGGNALKCAAGCPVEVVSAPVAAGIKVKGE
ncbi:ead/Ea22-like family protein [Salmonella enterica]|uniref:ead/Ea22-like family protein n=1 Tax=Salmonella enterica TaxID=28901 RepID=UPI0009AC1D57|nr:ead/Ea22-like family protein [Salmonella enterica]EIR5221649.1 ead/Ea22-like family protein [Salmonella enterica]EJH2168240.1 ead/Ea22-like family protein [Salmonella enterica]ELM5085514.1 ead/Ea22-like family protein [Salmonella enterica]ELZ4183779.1 ead/Ea22-like family protein [Salmonella enterica]